MANCDDLLAKPTILDNRSNSINQARRHNFVYATFIAIYHRAIGRYGIRSDQTISGRQYRYLQETYRESGGVHTRSTYLGLVDGGVRRRGGVIGLPQDLAEKDRNDFGSTRSQARERTAHEDRGRAKRARVEASASKRATGRSAISLRAISEITESQTGGGEADVGGPQAAGREAGAPNRFVHSRQLRRTVRRIAPAFCSYNSNEGPIADFVVASRRNCSARRIGRTVLIVHHAI